MRGRLDRLNKKKKKEKELIDREETERKRGIKRDKEEERERENVIRRTSLTQFLFYLPKLIHDPSLGRAFGV